jgi:GNAT superfamily N-acetyltransferase
MKEDKRTFEMDYVLNTPIGGDIENLEQNAYINEFIVSIYESSSEDNLSERQEVGRIKISVILNYLATNNRYDKMDLFDVSHSLFDIYQSIYDENCFNEIIEKAYPDLYDDVILVIENIEIIESHRGMGIGKMAIEDVIRRNNVNLMIVKPYPIQTDERRDGDKEWEKKLNFKSMNKDYDISLNKLNKFYADLGFVPIKGIDGLLFNYQQY